MMKQNIVRRLSLLFILTASASTAFAQTGAPISSVPFTIETSGDYYLESDISDASATLITVNAGAEATIDLNGHTLSSTSTAAAAMISNSGTLTIKDSSEGHTGTLDGMSKSKSFIGGCIVNNTGAVLAITGGTIQKFTSSKSGGAIYNMEGATLTIDGEYAVIANCTSSSSSSGNGGGAIFNMGTFTFKKGEIKSCTASSYSQGGAIWSGYSLSMEGGEITDCTSRRDGGAICVSGVSNSMSAGTISGCSANNGGAIQLNGNSKMIISGGTIEKCTATINGGGINSSSKDTLIISGGTIKLCKAQATGKDLGDNYGGGGICLYGESTLKMSGGALIDACTSTIRGGGLLLDHCYGTITGGTISNCSCSIDNTGHEGGGIYVGYGSLSLKNALITKNTAEIGGGGISSGNGAELIIYDGTVISYNKVVNANSHGRTDYGGGGICIGKFDSTNNFEMNGGSIINNECNQGGGGLYIRGGNNKVVVNSGIISDNVAGTDGGGLYTTGTAIFNGGEVSGNKAGGTGGGMYMGGSYTFTMTGGKILNNEAAGNGGGAFSASTVSLSGGTIEGNKSTSGNGGGIFVKSGNFSLTMCSLKSNEAICGGAFYVAEGINTVGAQVAIDNNQATQLGGGIYMASGTLNVNDSSIEITGNTSLVDGGGIYVAGGTSTFTGGEVRGNKAKFNGAALYSKSGTFNLNGTKFVANIAKGNGGAIYNDGATLNFTGSHISENNSYYDGGGLYNSTGTINLYRGTIDSNTASGNGGGIYSAGGTINFAKESGSTDYGRISNNTALNGGGVFLTSKAKMSFKYGLITGNQAKSNGTAIKTAYHSDPSLAGAEICGVGGGVYVSRGTSSSYLATLTFDSAEKSLGLFNNTADNAADDIYTDGQNTKLVLPNAKNVVLVGIAGKALGWFGDYVTNDEQYSNGILSSGRGARYRLEKDQSVQYVIAESTTSVTLSNSYVCLTLAIQPAYLTLQKSGLKKGESAVFILSNSTIQRKVMLTGIDDDGTTVSVSISNLEPGVWTVTEDNKWSWTYNEVLPQNVTLDGTEAKTVSFSNEKSTSEKPSNDEAVKKNTLGKSFSINMGGSYLE